MEKKEALGIICNLAEYVHYSHYQGGISPVKRLYVRNNSDEDSGEVTITVSAKPAFAIETSVTQNNIPRKANVRFDIDMQLSPVFLSSLDSAADGEITVKVTKDRKVLAQGSFPIEVLGYNDCFLKGDASNIARYVQQNSIVDGIVREANKCLLEWDKKAVNGYGERSKNDVRFAVASIYTVLAAKSFTEQRATEGNITHLNPPKLIMDSRVATQLELALIYAGAIEAKGLNAVLGEIDGEYYVGAWLKEACFDDVVEDDLSAVSKRLAKGVNNISMIAVRSLFSSHSYEASEKEAQNAVRNGGDTAGIVDIRRARILKIRPLPERVKKESGYNLIEQEEKISYAAPSNIKEYDVEVGLDGAVGREMQWERRLLDLSMKNSLLNFNPASSAVLHLLTCSLEDFITRGTSGEEYSLYGSPMTADQEYKSFGGTVDLKPLQDLIRIDMNNGKIHAVYSEKELDKKIINIYRKERTFMEESGSASLYLACGFLKWFSKDGAKEPKYAPIILVPVSLVRKTRGNSKYALTISEEEIRINNTLLEFLYQEFGMDMRGLANIKLELDAPSILGVIARIRKEIVDITDWDITDDVYLTPLSFSSYLMWKDVRTKIDIFKQNKIIASLIEGQSVFTADEQKMAENTADESYLEDGVYMPIGADSSQYGAIVDSLSKSFVLHGPPGTGKSQTITNIIANNIVKGRRVLFVAEKMAALEVVKKRLDAIGIGDFCLELHSNKTDKNQVVAKILENMNLPRAAQQEDYAKKARIIAQGIADIQASIDALHRRRYLGFSINDAMVRYMDTEDVPECLRMDSLFYEKLTKDSLEKYERLLAELVSCAKECGDIPNSPLKRLGGFEYNNAWRIKAESAIDIHLLLIEYIRKVADMVFEELNVRTVNITPVKLKALREICNAFNDKNDKFLNYFAYPVEEGWIKINSYLQVRDKYAIQEKMMRKLYSAIPDDVDVDEFEQEMSKEKSRYCVKVFKKLARYAYEDMVKESMDEYLGQALNYYRSKNAFYARAAEVAKLFSVDGSVADIGEIDGLIEKLKKLYDNAESVYADFSRAAFNSLAHNLRERAPLQIFRVYLSSYEQYERERDKFIDIFKYRYDDSDAEDVLEERAYVLQLKANIDKVHSWSKYNAIVDDCKANGLDFIIELLNNGVLSTEEVLRSFRRAIYGNFIKTEIALDNVLAEFSGKTIEDKLENIRALMEEYEFLTRQELYYKLVDRIPRPSEEGAHNIEMVILQRAEKNRMKGVTLRKLFEQIPTVMRAACPCMLMSPTSVTQYLDPEWDKFDLVVFDEASQMPTCEAIGAIARGKDIIVVGDPEQLPPTSFFASDYKDTENLEYEDLDSILDDCLALGMPQRHLLWHYRSHHESLIAFSNSMYYDNKLLTFPSPGEINSKVSLRYIPDGVYERGGHKVNRKEAEALVAEVMRRLNDPIEKKKSIGIVTFNTSQQNYIEDLVNQELRKHNLDDYVAAMEEPVFVKNLENVQGDERDVILFSVGFGPDMQGKLSLNFGPLNQTGGYRRLNVAVTRARMEMVVFSSITANMIDLNRTDSKGIKGLKAFLEYAEKGREMLTIGAKDISKDNHNISEYIARDLRDVGLKCEYNFGVSNFKIDVAVVDPVNKDRYILGIICDSENSYNIKSVHDRISMYGKIMKQLGWNTYYLWMENYFNNPKREIAKIKEYVMNLAKKKEPTKKSIKDTLNKYRRQYKSCYIKPLKAGAEYVLNEANEENIIAKIDNILSVEQPVEEGYILEKLYAIFNVAKTSKKAVQRLQSLLRRRNDMYEEIEGAVYYRDNDTLLQMEYFRPCDKVKRDIREVHPYELVACAKCVVETKGSVDMDTLEKDMLTMLGIARKSKWTSACIGYAIELGIERKMLIKAVDGKLTN